VVLKDRGQTLRFYRAQNLRLKSDTLLEFLKEDGWKQTPPWSSEYGPGGSREYILNYLAIGLTKFYNVAVVVPRWVLLLFSGTIGSLIISFLHKSPPTERPPSALVQPKRSSSPPEQPTPESTGQPQTTASSNSAPTKRGPAKTRKGRK